MQTQSHEWSRASPLQQTAGQLRTAAQATYKSAKEAEDRQQRAM